MTRLWRQLGLAAGGLGIAGLGALALVWWRFLPTPLPTKGPPLAPLVREALCAESNGPIAPLLRTHVGLLVASGALPRESELWLHLRELALAAWLKVWWTREEQIDGFAAMLWTGAGRYGIDTGATYLFGKGSAELSPSQLATLLAVVRSPKGFDPACYPDRALGERNNILRRLAERSLLSGPTVDAALLEPLRVQRACEL